jgi:Flp pilus assembly pilin Flp
MRLFHRSFRRQRGQGLIEYSLLISLVAITLIVTIALLGPQINSFFHQITSSLSSPSTPAATPTATPGSGGYNCGNGNPIPGNGTPSCSNNGNGNNGNGTGNSADNRQALNSNWTLSLAEAEHPVT